MTDEELLAELARVVAARDELERRRDELIRELMHTHVPRDAIAATAGLKVARLYQVRDGRR